MRGGYFLTRKRYSQHQTSLVVLALLLSWNAFSWAEIYDLSPAPFRGRENTTLQEWDFLAYDPAIMIGEAQDWIVNDNGHHGVWHVDRSIYSDLIIPVNCSHPIRIWLQVNYTPDTIFNNYPLIFHILNPSLSYQPSLKIETKKIDSLYETTSFTQILPSSYQIFIRPRDCWIKVDSVIVETQAIVGDIDLDLEIDLDDLAILADQWLQPPGNPSADLNSDNIVNGLDLALFCENWLVEIPSPTP